MRSSVVPQTIASATAQKTNWKNHSVSAVTPCSLVGNASGKSLACATKKPWVPISASVPPKASAKPTA